MIENMFTQEVFPHIDVYERISEDIELAVELAGNGDNGNMRIEDQGKYQVVFVNGLPVLGLNTEMHGIGVTEHASKNLVRKLKNRIGFWA